jgi:hypothetical protein
MTTESSFALLTAAIAEVAASPQSMKKLARAASSRANLEREWVYEIDGTDVLEDVETRREVSLGGRHHADLEIEGTVIEFKSTKPWYAGEKAFEDRIPPRRNSAEFWLSGDMTRMEERDGIFVLLVSTADEPVHKDWSHHSIGEMRDLGVRRYTDWLQTRADQVRAGAVVEVVAAGHGDYAGKTAQHDALIVWWPTA